QAPRRGDRRVEYREARWPWILVVDRRSMPVVAPEGGAAAPRGRAGDGRDRSPRKKEEGPHAAAAGGPPCGAATSRALTKRGCCRARPAGAAPSRATRR